MRFARRAKWLTHLFTASVTPPTSFPDSYSRDVSLVAPYDGGGWGMTPAGEWGTEVVSAAGASDSTALLTVGDNEIFRLLSISCKRTAGADATLGIGRLQVSQTSFLIAITGALAAIDAEDRALTPINTPILPPGGVLSGRHAGGDVLTVVTWRVLGVRLPLGTSPTI